MKEILTDLERWQQQGEEIALATLVRVHRSAPRPPGARLCLTRSGKLAGSVSAGCVENDVFERALKVLEDGQPVVASYGIADELAAQVGLSCGGSIDVLIEVFRVEEVWQVVREAVQSERPAALAIGLTPDALLGRKLALVGEDSCVGSLDSELDAQVLAEARGLLLNAGARVLTFPWRGEEATVFIETFLPPPQLYIVGATHTAVALCRMAKGLGFRVSVIDARSVFATEERFPEADELLHAWPDDVLDESRLDGYAFVVSLTHDPKFDLPTLARALRSDVRYIGALGSRVTHEKRKAALREQGFSDDELARIHAPIGLDLGGRSPQEIALAILAEMTAVRYGKEARPLGERCGAIHADD